MFFSGISQPNGTENDANRSHPKIGHKRHKKQASKAICAFLEFLRGQISWRFPSVYSVVLSMNFILFVQGYPQAQDFQDRVPFGAIGL
jgi:hypothetical protein